MKKLLFVLAIAMCCLVSCDKEEDNAQGIQKTKVSEWSGSFTGTIQGGVLHFTLFSDNSINLDWEVSDAICNGCTGTYSLNGTDFSFNVSGTASSNKESSDFTMFSEGTLNPNSGNGSYSISFTNPVFLDQDGSWNVSLAGSQHATITVKLALPADAEGKTGAVIFDTDFDTDNGVVYAFVGACPYGTLIGIELYDVPAGTYYLYGGIWVVGEYGDDPAPGDFIGIYGSTYPNFPQQPNATVPSSGSKTFNIDLVVIN